MKKLFLTFDDGPSKEYTYELLNLLDEYNIKATFFLVAEFAKKNPDVVNEEIKRGHKICLHANRHLPPWLLIKPLFLYDINKAMETLNGMGIEPTFYRPPWGMIKPCSKREAESRGMTLIRWDVMADDWRATTTPSVISRKIMERTFPGAVICLHDGRGRNHAPSRTIEALRDSLPKLLEKGYVFETL